MVSVRGAAGRRADLFPLKCEKSAGITTNSKVRQFGLAQKKKKGCAKKLTRPTHLRNNVACWDFFFGVDASLGIGIRG